MFGKLLAQTTILINSSVLLLGEYRFIHMSLKLNNTLLLKKREAEKTCETKCGQQKATCLAEQVPKNTTMEGELQKHFTLQIQ
jgi:hypothetical protein